jgi:choline dehydrogenase-like flavoprotein
VARRLADASSNIKVLLLEAGGTNDEISLRSVSNRWAGPTFPALNWGYMSTPQTHLAGQQLPIIRGKGLGGSSAINYCCWLIGHKDDFNQWAAEVEDDAWKWEGPGGVKERFRKIERMQGELDEKTARYINREAQELHSKNGNVDISYNHLLGDLELNAFKAAEEIGVSLYPCGIASMLRLQLDPDQRRS